MRQIFRYLALLSLPVMVMTSCVQDNGNYEYSELPAMNVSEFEVTNNGNPVSLLEDNLLVVTKGDKVTISPKFNIDSSIDPEYLWVMNPERQDAPEPPTDTISMEMSASFDFAMTPDLYNIRLIITDKNNPKYKQYYKIPTVIEGFYGLMILHEGSNGADISALKTVEIDKYQAEGYKLEDGLYSNANGGEKLMKANHLTANNASSYKKASSYFIGGEDMIWQANIDFENVSRDTESMFHANALPILANSMFMVTYYNFAFSIINNKLYAMNDGFYSYVGYQQFPEDEYSGEYTPHIAIKQTFSGHVAYNKKMKRYETLGTGYGNYFSWYPQFSSVNYPDPAELRGDLAEAARLLDPIHFGFGNGGTIVAPSTDGMGKYSIVKITDFDDDDSGNVYSNVLSIFDAPGMMADSKFAYSLRGDYIFYSSNNDVYVANTRKESAENANLNLPSNEKITKLYLFSNSASVNDGLILFIGTDNGDGSGKVYQYRISAISGAIDLATKVEVTGLGVVKDFAYVEPLSN